MLDMFFKVLSGIWDFAKLLVYPCVVFVALFFLLCAVHFFYFVVIKKQPLPKSGQVKQRRCGILKSLLFDVPRRYVLDRLSREEGYFYPRGIHMFCGEQGSGKTTACTEMMLRLHSQYPQSKMITNYGVKGEDDELDDWHKLLDYTNGHQGVIVGIDEIQNWFMSGTNKLPEEMLEVATQNRKNNRILCCTAQVFTRVNKALREQVSLVYNPHTIFGCYTIVIIRKPEFDDEGNVTKLKYRGIYGFVHSDALRDSFDTYKVIHTLSKEGFKEKPIVNQSPTIYNILTDGKKKAR